MVQNAEVAIWRHLLGAELATLLVRLKRLLPILFVLLAAAPAAADQTVRAADYDAYWLWAGVKGRPELEKAKTIYLLLGEIGADRSGSVRLKAQGATEPGPHDVEAKGLGFAPEVAKIDAGFSRHAPCCRQCSRQQTADRKL
jgi:hypothetical protein